MNCGLPTRPKQFVRRKTRVLTPALINEIYRTVGTTGPGERRHSFDQSTKVQRLFDAGGAIRWRCHWAIIGVFLIKEEFLKNQDYISQQALSMQAVNTGPCRAP